MKILYIYARHKKVLQNIKGVLKMARVLISMPESFLGKIDEVAENESRSRSELIREALRSYITKSQVRRNTLADKNARILEALLD